MSVLSNQVTKGKITVISLELEGGVNVEKPFDVDAHIEAVKIAKGLLTIKNETPNPVNLTGVVVYTSGRTPYEIYKFEVTTDFEDDAVNMIYRGTFRNVEEGNQSEGGSQSQEEQPSEPA